MLLDVSSTQTKIKPTISHCNFTIKQLEKRSTGKHREDKYIEQNIDNDLEKWNNRQYNTISTDQRIAKSIQVNWEKEVSHATIYSFYGFQQE